MSSASSRQPEASSEFDGLRERCDRMKPAGRMSPSGTGLRFKTLDHGGESDTMPQAMKLTDAQGRSCIYVPITQNGKVVNSQGFVVRPRR